MSRKRAPASRSTRSRQHVAVEAQRQSGERRCGHRRAAEKRHRDPVIHLLVGKQRQMGAAAQRRNRPPRGDRAFRDQLAAIAAEPRDHAVDQGIVGGAVDLGKRDPVLDGGKRGDLPIGDMAGENDHPPARRDRSVDMLKAARLDPAARLEDADVLQMRVFGRDAAEIVPHAANDVRDLALRKLGKARRRLCRARLEMPRDGPISAPVRRQGRRPDRAATGRKRRKTRRPPGLEAMVGRGALAGSVRPAGVHRPWAERMTGSKSRSSAIGIAPADFDLEHLDAGALGRRHPHDILGGRDQTGARALGLAAQASSSAPRKGWWSGNARAPTSSAPSARKVAKNFSGRPIPAKGQKREPASRSPATAPTRAQHRHARCRVAAPRRRSPPPRCRAARRRRRGRGRAAGSRAAARPGSLAHCQNHSRHRRREATRVLGNAGF